MNKRGTGTTTLWLTSFCTQGLLLITLFSERTYEFLILLTASTLLIPYFWVALFQITSLFRRQGQLAPAVTTGRGKDLILGIIATIYACWLIFAGGLEFLLLALLTYLIGTVLYVWGRRQSRGRVFTALEWAVFAIIAIGSVVAIVAFASGALAL